MATDLDRKAVEALSLLGSKGREICYPPGWRGTPAMFWRSHSIPAHPDVLRWVGEERLLGLMAWPMFRAEHVGSHAETWTGRGGKPDGAIMAVFESEIGAAHMDEAFLPLLEGLEVHFAQAPADEDLPTNKAPIVVVGADKDGKWIVAVATCYPSPNPHGGAST